MRRLWNLLKHYYLFFAAALATLVALPLDIWVSHPAAHWVLGIVALLEVIPLLWGMIEDLRSGTYGVDVLAATAIVASVLLHQYWAGMVIVLMLTGGEGLEDYAEHRAEHELSALLERAPQKALVLRGRKEVEINASDVQAGDKVIIKAGELVPVDAVVLEGSASFDESSLTGESLPQPKDSGDQLLSGAINLDGSVVAKALHTAADSQYQQIIKLVRAARHSQAPFVRLADRYAVPFTLVSFAIAGGVWLVSGSSLRFLEVLVVATPCPLILAAPIAIISGMSRAAKHGIIVKTGSSLERLAQAKTFAFDKTGTLTKGNLRVERIATFSKISRSELLGLAASLEQHSTHTQARAIVSKAQAEHAKLVKVTGLREIPGKGLTASSKGQDVVLGRLTLLEEQAVSFPKTFAPKDYNQTAAFVAMNGILVGVITFADELRDESKETLRQLRSLGINNFMMITGDNSKTALTVAKQLGITDVEAGALPGDKIRAIERLKARPVAFVGDGVNDAPVLTASEVGIALGARGSAAASESADIVILKDDLTRTALGAQIARRSFRIAKQSIWVGIGMSVGLMVIFASGRFLPIYGAAIQELVDVVVIFNALRAHSGGQATVTANS
ncbi:MAG TPA: heavy metal translocating P-type ATPase [Candidatus Saccharimonadales bacterium]|nr:heavy metal translocating P-type ATPase [Candidatus Saccharimonadales bacterium]